MSTVPGTVPSDIKIFCAWHNAKEIQNQSTKIETSPACFDLCPRVKPWDRHRMFGEAFFLNPHCIWVQHPTIAAQTLVVLIS
jgi:hypothetical protein